MNFTEYFEAYEEASNIFDFNMEKLNAYIESVEREYEMDCNSIGIYVVQESGTIDDLNYLYEAASNNRNAKSKSWLKRLIDNFVSFVQTIIEKLKNLFTSKTTQDNLKKMKNTLDKDPKLANKKIQYTDYSKDIKELKRDIDKSNKSIATGKPSMSTRKKVLVGTTVTVTLAGALALLGKLNKDTIKECENQKNKVMNETIEKLLNSDDYSISSTTRYKKHKALNNALARYLDSDDKNLKNKYKNASDEIKSAVNSSDMLSNVSKVIDKTPELKRVYDEEKQKQFKDFNVFNDEMKKNIDMRKMLITARQTSLKNLRTSIISAFKSIPSTIKSVPDNLKSIPNKFMKKAKSDKQTVANESYYDDDFELESYDDYDDDFELESYYDDDFEF